MRFRAIHAHTDIGNADAERIRDLGITHVFEEEGHDLAIRDLQRPHCFEETVAAFTTHKALMRVVLAPGQRIVEQIHLRFVRVPDDVIQAAIVNDSKQEGPETTRIPERWQRFVNRDQNFLGEILTGGLVSLVARDDPRDGRSEFRGDFFESGHTIHSLKTGRFYYTKRKTFSGAFP